MISNDFLILSEQTLQTLKAALRTEESQLAESRQQYEQQVRAFITDLYGILR